MPHSYPEFKQEIKQHFIDFIPKSSKILDVGPGAGVYGKLLSSAGYELDCLEIWEPYIKKFNLESIYKNVFLGDVRSFDISKYHYIIMGDVLEHLTLKEATLVLNDISDFKIKCLVAVPYNYAQGEYEGNVYETHWQPDLTPQNVLQRYPQLRELNICTHTLNGIPNVPFYGYYINYRKNY